MGNGIIVLLFSFKTVAFVMQPSMIVEFHVFSRELLIDVKIGIFNEKILQRVVRLMRQLFPGLIKFDTNFFARFY